MRMWTMIALIPATRGTDLGVRQIVKSYYSMSNTVCPCFTKIVELESCKNYHSVAMY